MSLPSTMIQFKRADGDLNYASTAHLQQGHAVGTKRLTEGGRLSDEVPPLAEGDSPSPT